MEHANRGGPIGDGLPPWPDRGPVDSYDREQVFLIVIVFGIIGSKLGGPRWSKVAGFTDSPDRDGRVSRAKNTKLTKQMTCEKTLERFRMLELLPPRVVHLMPPLPKTTSSLPLPL